MGPAETISITMTPAMMRAVERSVEVGDYASADEAVGDALRIWQRERDERTQRLAAIKARIRRSIDDPRPSLTAAAVKDQIDRLHDESLRPNETSSWEDTLADRRGAG